MDDNIPTDGRPGDRWPLPPPWMWGCGPCAELYRSMMEIVNAVGPRDLSNDSYAAQLQLAQHLAKEHTPDVPEPVGDCRVCRHYEDMRVRLGPRYDWLGREHRARHLFVPANIVGLA